MRPVFLSFEGGEGVGKTTQIARLARRLEALGRSVVVTREPGGTKLGRTIRELLVQESADPPTALAELFLYAADRAHHVATLVRPAMDAGSTVLCDRYADATEAYQGWGRSIPLQVVQAANALATAGLLPDRTVLLDADPGVGLDRARTRQESAVGPREERFEAEERPFHDRVRAGYLAIAHAHPERVRIVDGSGDPAVVEARVWDAVKDLLKG